MSAPVRGGDGKARRRASRRATSAARRRRSSALQGSLGKLIAVAEAYPELKANKNFLELQQQLAEIEDQLQMARRYYNGAVRNLNIGIQSFPEHADGAACRLPRGAVLRARRSRRRRRRRRSRSRAAKS